MNERNNALTLILSIGGRYVTFGHRTTYRIRKTEGLEAGKYSLLLLQSASVDGAVVGGVRYLPRTILVEFDVVCDDRDGVHRDALASFFHPGKDGILTVLRGDRKRQIGCRMEEVVFSQETAFCPLRVALRLLCPDPFFTDSCDRVEKIDTEVPLFTFPLTSALTTGFTMGTTERRYSVTLHNEGSLPTGVTAVFTHKKGVSGAVVSPGITLNGAGVTVLDSLTEEDEFVVSTCPGSKKVLKNGENQYSFARTSIFFEIPAGDSTVTFTAGENLAALSGEVRFRCRWLYA